MTCSNTIYWTSTVIMVVAMAINVFQVFRWRRILARQTATMNKLAELYEKERLNMGASLGVWDYVLKDR